MFAIVDVSGKQYKISPQDKIVVDLLDLAPGQDFNIDQVLLTCDDQEKNCQIGQPYVDLTIPAKVIEHTKDEKITIFKKKAKKRYERTQGHRQDYTIIQIGDF